MFYKTGTMLNAHKILIKGMVCQRCIAVLRDKLVEIRLDPQHIALGEVTFSGSYAVPDLTLIDEKIRPLGFSVLEDKNAKVIKGVKKLVEEVYNGDFEFPLHFRFSDLVSKRLNKEYDSVSSLFSSLEKVTIEKYIINYRIEKVKEFLVYTSQKLDDIAFRLGFTSVAHLSRQFKSVTGVNPSHFREIRAAKLITSGSASH